LSKCFSAFFSSRFICLGRHTFTFTFYGIGDVVFKGGTLENRSMVGVAVEQDSIHMIQNPASYANLKLTTLL
jgi:hypothetical protein